jgi:methylated-DNA-[protein]-cysteine S-methyltransferase
MPPLKIQTTPFRKQVWEIMLKIPYGKTISYGEIAAKIAKKKGIKKMSAQAVGGAVGNNAIAIIIPCHRVIGTDGSLTGYDAGLSKKIKLLKLEKAI